MRLVLYVTIETLRVVAILLQPIMPAAWGSCSICWRVPPDARTFAALETGEARAPRRAAPARAGQGLPAPAPVFPRYVEPEAAAQ